MNQVQNLDLDPMILIHDVARLMRVRADQRARAQKTTRAQWVMIARLARRPGLSQNELAALTDVEPITIARAIDRLEAQGLVERRRDASDRRINRLYLLPAARPILDELGAYRRELNAELTAGMNQEACRAVIEGLLTMKANLTSREDTRRPAVPATAE
jgi:DNA-binding MarR family transcriptional regulator